MSTHENEVYLHNKYEQFKESQSGFDRAVILNELRNFGLEDAVKEMVEDWWEEKWAWMQERNLEFKDIHRQDDEHEFHPGEEFYFDTTENGNPGEDGYSVDTREVYLPDWLDVEHWSKLATKPKDMNGRTQENMDMLNNHGTVECPCNDPSCPVRGLEGEYNGHIEECCCADCHRYYGKISG